MKDLSLDLLMVSSIQLCSDFGLRGILSSFDGKSSPLEDPGDRTIYNPEGQLQLTIKKQSAGDLNVYNPKGQLLSKIKGDPSRSQNIYNAQGQLQLVIKRASDGDLEVYNSIGQLKSRIDRTSSGNQNIYNSEGQLLGYITPKGLIMNQLSQEIGQIR